MIIIGATREQLDTALAVVSLCYAGNVRWNRCEPMNRAGTRHRVTLRVETSRGPGAGRGLRGRRLVSACWHVHGRFMDSLPNGAVIRAQGRMIRPGGRWHDYNVGSIFYPMQASEACVCEGD